MLAVPSLTQTIGHSEFGSDREHSYLDQTILVDSPMFKDSLRKTVGPNATTTPRIGNNAQLQVFPMPAPPPMVDNFTLGWLAFVAQCTLDARGKGLIPSPFFQPAFFQRGEVLAREDWSKVNAQWKFSDREPKVLESLVIYYTDRAGKETKNRTNAIYQVLTWTNIGKRFFPKEFFLTRYLPDGRSSADELIVESESLGITRFIEEKSSLSIPQPPVSSRTRVIDTRFPS